MVMSGAIKKVALLASTGLMLSLVACSQANSDDAISQTTTSQMGELVDSAATQFMSIDGEPMSLADYSGNVLLVVNTASKCGFTPQYEGLQSLWTEYKDDGLIVVGIPSGDFAGQEFDKDSEVKEFCQLNYGVDFPLTSKNHVVGEDAHPFYTYAKEHLGEEAVPQWNFHKILIGRDGTPVKAFGTRVAPEDEELVSAVKAALG